VTGLHPNGERPGTSAAVPCSWAVAPGIGSEGDQESSCPRHERLPINSAQFPTSLIR
jgi:hypothetical protein